MIAWLKRVKRWCDDTYVCLQHCKAGHLYLNLDIPPAARQRIEDLKRVSGAPDDVEIIRRSLQFYSTLWQAKTRDGVILVLRDANGSEEPVELW